MKYGVYCLFSTSFPSTVVIKQEEPTHDPDSGMGRQLDFSETFNQQDTLTRQKTRVDRGFTATALTVAAANEAPALPTVSQWI